MIIIIMRRYPPVIIAVFPISCWLSVGKVLAHLGQSVGKKIKVQ